MNSHAYQRQVIAYHGCDRQTFEQVLLRGERLRPSERPWDWLGRGIYFWEHGPERARQWANEKRARGDIQEAAVLGAVIQLGNCFDLLDTRYTGLLAQAWPQLLESLKATGKGLPENQSGDPNDPDFTASPTSKSPSEIPLAWSDFSDHPPSVHEQILQSSQFARPSAPVGQGRG